jgi:hypothetical protein
MNYKETMPIDKEKFSFINMYENAIVNKQKTFFLKEDLTQLLKEKRELGLKKYGDLSFQSSLENCITCPTLEHAQEEIIDCLNYLLHEQYKNDLLGKSNDKLKTVTSTVIGLYSTIEDLQHI